MTNVRVMTTNYLDPDIISNSYVSSEQAAFPVSNLYNAQRRSKVWRSNGNWEVTSENNVIIFRETAAGPNLTATITVDEYASTTLFCAAIKAALEAAGDSTYTVSQDATTKKIKIVSNGSGGDNTFSLMWTNASSEGFAEMTGFSTALDDTGGLTYIADELKIHTSEWIKWDMGISTNPTAFIMIGARNSPIKITPSATLKLQGNETDVWDDPSYEATLTYDDQAISMFDDEGLHTEALRYWRLFIEDQDNAAGYIELGSVYLGIYATPSRGAVQFPLQGRFIDRSQTTFSEGGQTFSDIRQKSELLQFEWRGLTLTEKEEFDDHWDNVGTSLPFFIQLDPLQVFSSRAAKYIRFVKFDGEPSYSLDSFNNFSSSWAVREEL